MTSNYLTQSELSYLKAHPDEINDFVNDIVNRAIAKHLMNKALKFTQEASDFVRNTNLNNSQDYLEWEDKLNDISVKD